MIPMIAVLLAVPSAWAGPKHDAVMDLLNAYDEPVREADLRALGDGIDLELMEIAKDAAVPVTRRGKAVVALQYYPSEPVRLFVEAQATPGGDALLRRKAVYSLAAWGAPSVPTLASALSDADLQLRIAAAKSLGKVADPAAKAALAARLPAETETAVRDAIQKSLGETK